VLFHPRVQNEPNRHATFDVFLDAFGRILRIYRVSCLFFSVPRLPEHIVSNLYLIIIIQFLHERLLHHDLIFDFSVLRIVGTRKLRHGEIMSRKCSCLNLIHISALDRNRIEALMENGSQRVRFANALHLRCNVKERSNDRCIAAAERIAALERNGAFSNKFLTKVITRPFLFP